MQQKIQSLESLVKQLNEKVSAVKSKKSELKEKLKMYGDELSVQAKLRHAAEAAMTSYKSEIQDL